MEPPVKWEHMTPMTQREANNKRVIDYLAQFGIKVIAVVGIERSRAVLTIHKPVRAILTLNKHYRSKNKHLGTLHKVRFDLPRKRVIGVSYHVGSSATGTLVMMNNGDIK